MKRKCSVCKLMFPTKEIRSVCHTNYCRACYAIKKKNHRQETKKLQPGYLENVARRNKAKKPLPNINNAIKPKIEEVKRKKVGNLGLYISNDESTFLYHKHLKEGLSPKEASECVKVIKEELKDLAEKLKAAYNRGVMTEKEVLIEKNKFMEGLR